MIQDRNTSPLPWHQPLVAKLEQAKRSGRMPHALLIHGVEGLGKRLFATWLARALLCESAGERLSPCGRCASCQLLAAGTHPDFISVEPEEDKQQISVEQIRAMSERLSMTSTRQGYRVAIVDPAHQLTISAANSMLKTLEEPGANSLLILLSSKPSNVLPTLRSRCQQLGMHRPSLEQAQAWLRGQTDKTLSAELLSFAGGAPLRALSYAEARFEQLQKLMLPAMQDLLANRADVTQVAHSWNDEQLPDRLLWFDWWLCRLLRQKITGNDDQVTRDAITAGAIGLPSQPHLLNISGLFSVLDRLRELKAQLTRTALQKELALEQLLIGFLQVLELRPG